MPELWERIRQQRFDEHSAYMNACRKPEIALYRILRPRRRMSIIDTVTDKVGLCSAAVPKDRMSRYPFAFPRGDQRVDAEASTVRAAMRVSEGCVLSPDYQGENSMPLILF